MKGILVARRYAKALYGLVTENNREKLEADIRLLKQIVTENPQPLKKLNSNAIPAKERLRMAQEIASELTEKELWQRFFAILIQNERFAILPLILEQLGALLRESRNLVAVTLELAFEPEKATLSGMKSIIEEKLGKEAVLDIVINKSILGGFVASTGNFLMDASVRGNLKKFSKTILQ